MVASALLEEWGAVIRGPVGRHVLVAARSHAASRVHDMDLRRRTLRAGGAGVLTGALAQSAEAFPLSAATAPACPQGAER